jgi:cytochrome P450
MSRELQYSLRAPLRFDFESAAAKADPVSFFARLREAGPVIPVKLPFVGKVWVTTTHEAASAMVKDNALFVQEARHAGKSGVAGMAWWMPASLKLLTNNMLLKDEPDHRRLRKLVDKAFQRRRVRDMRGEIEAIADRLLDGFAGRDEVDLATEFSRPLPLEVICALLGLPEHDRDVFSVWAKTATSMRSSFGIFRAFLSMRGVIDYVRGQIDDCRRNPRDGLITELVHAEEDGDKLSEDELISMVFLLLFAGFETTTHLISDSIIALEQNPAQKAYLLADPAGRMERAVEELGRYATLVQSTKPRYASRDCEFFGQALKRGDIVMGLSRVPITTRRCLTNPASSSSTGFPIRISCSAQAFISASACSSRASRRSRQSPGSMSAIRTWCSPSPATFNGSSVSACAASPACRSG